jgi:hypothetical protein
MFRGLSGTIRRSRVAGTRVHHRIIAGEKQAGRGRSVKAEMGFPGAASNKAYFVLSRQFIIVKREELAAQSIWNMLG